MNYKGTKDKIFKCLSCNEDIKFRWYSGRRHLFCNRQCQADFQFKETLKRFKLGLLTYRPTIYRCLIYLHGNICSICNLGNVWNSKRLRLWVDHKDGNATNNKSKNLRLVCPNCTSQLETSGSRNKGFGRKSRGLRMYG